MCKVRIDILNAIWKISNITKYWILYKESACILLENISWETKQNTVNIEKKTPSSDIVKYVRKIVRKVDWIRNTV